MFESRKPEGLDTTFDTEIRGAEVKLLRQSLLASLGQYWRDKKLDQSCRGKYGKIITKASWSYQHQPKQNAGNAPQDEIWKFTARLPDNTESAEEKPFFTLKIRDRFLDANCTESQAITDLNPWRHNNIHDGVRLKTAEISTYWHDPNTILDENTLPNIPRGEAVSSLLDFVEDPFDALAGCTLAEDFTTWMVKWEYFF